jgi:hypothetical protein
LADIARKRRGKGARARVLADPPYGRVRFHPDGDRIVRQEIVRRRRGLHDSGFVELDVMRQIIERRVQPNATGFAGADITSEFRRRLRLLAGLYEGSYLRMWL